MIRYDLKGKAAIVTGAASGIGLATATILARAGAAVALNFLPDDDRGPAVVRQLKAAGGNVIGAPGNVGDPASADKMVKEAIGRLGHLDLLVNNAGTPATRTVIPPSALDMVTEEFWRAIIGTNLLSVFFCTRAAAKALKASRGAMVSTASIAGMDAVGSSLAYGAAKAGVIT